MLDVLGPPPEPDAPPPVYVLREGQDPWRHDLPAGAVVRLDGGGECALPAELPGPLPHGRHVLELPDREVPLIVAPRTAHPPADRREWGLAVQLYALRSAASWGIGDLGDLAAAAGARRASRASCCCRRCTRRRSRRPVQPSPYYASSRRARNPLHIAVGAVPEVAALDGAERAAFEALAEQGRALSELPLIDRDAVLRVEGGGAADRVHGPAPRSGARRWRRTAAATPTPTGSRRSPCSRGGTAATGAAGRPRAAIPPAPRWRGWCARRRGEVAFHAWLQLLADEQLARRPGRCGSA